jgi:hypothetical protein
MGLSGDLPAISVMVFYRCVNVVVGAVRVSMVPLTSGQLLGLKKGLLMKNIWMVILLVSATPAVAQNDSKYDHDPRFSVSLGVFITDRDFNTRINGEAGSGTDVDLEDDLGLRGSDSVFRVDGYWRFADKHRFDFSAFDLSRSATKQIEREIDWGDTTYPISATLETDVDLAIYKAAYTYMFLKQDRSFLGGTIGLYIADIGTSLSSPNTGSIESNNVTAPMPVIGLRGEYRFADRWSLRGSGEFFVVDSGDVDGSLYDIYAGVDFSATQNVAIGLGFNAVKIDIGVDKNSFQGNVDWQYSGALAFLKFDF